MVGVLFVCAGNTCRSPMAEAAFRRWVEDAGLGGRITIDSAGTNADRRGAPPDPRAVAEAARRGIEIAPRRARQLSSDDFRRFDLILAMDRGHIATLSRLAPDSGRAEVRLFMDFAPEGSPAEVPDPYYGELADYDYALDLIEPGVAGLIEALQRDYL